MQPFLKEVLLPYEELAAAEAKVMTLQLDQDGQLKIDPRCMHHNVLLIY